MTDGSSLQIVGAVRTPAWTKLAETATIGSNTITLQEPVNWEVGDIIVIASTDYETEKQVPILLSDKMSLFINVIEMR